MPRDGAMTLVDECEPTLAVRKEWMGRSLLALVFHHFEQVRISSSVLFKPNSSKIGTLDGVLVFSVRPVSFQLLEARSARRSPVNR